MDKLPIEIWYHIFDYLNDKHIIAVNGLNKFFRNILNNSILYNRRIQNEFINVPNHTITRDQYIVLIRRWVRVKNNLESMFATQQLSCKYSNGNIYMFKVALSNISQHCMYDIEENSNNEICTRNECVQSLYIQPMELINVIRLGKTTTIVSKRWIQQLNNNHNKLL